MSEEKTIRRQPSLDVENREKIQDAIAEHISIRGVYLLIFLYAADGTPLDRVLWLRAEMERRSLLIQSITDQKIKSEIRTQSKIQEMKNEILKNPRANHRKMAISLSQIYCIAFDQPMPTRRVVSKKERRCCDGYDCYKTVTPSFDVPSMTKNFRKLLHEQPDLLMHHGN